MNRLYFGDNLAILLRSDKPIPEESVDLIYLDPPFNSNASYNLLFESSTGMRSDAQIAAFEDTWHWGPQAEREFTELVQGTNNLDVAEMMQALRKFLGDNDMMAYLTMMARRLLELHRVLKPTGSLYLHCDPNASHYLKIVLDGVFGPENFRNEVIWKRTSAHSSAKRWGDVHDTLLFYSKSTNYRWNQLFQAHDAAHVASKYATKDQFGQFMPADLTGAGVRSGDSGKPWRGHDPNALGRHWAVPTKVPMERLDLSGWNGLSTQQKLDRLEATGLIYWPAKKGGFPRFKRYLAEGVPIQSVITDIAPVNSQAQERIGYPTQKPVALIERIIQASSKEGDVILDPFCGCGTAVHAAHNLKRQWIGIDITPVAINTIEDRLGRAFPGLTVAVDGKPKDLAGAVDLAERSPHQFELWACDAVGAKPYRPNKRGADSGIDGVIYFEDGKRSTKKIVVSVKSGRNISVQMIRELRGVVERDKAAIGMFVTLTPPTGPMRQEAVKAGYFTSANGSSFPKLQIVTIKGLLNGLERPRYPDLSSGGHRFQATTERAARQRKLFEQPDEKENVESMLGYLATEARKSKPGRRALRAKNGTALKKTV